MNNTIHSLDLGKAHIICLPGCTYEQLFNIDTYIKDTLPQLKYVLLDFEITSFPSITLTPEEIKKAIKVNREKEELKVGDRVRVIDYIPCIRKNIDPTLTWVSPMDKLMGEEGTVTYRFADGVSSVKLDNGSAWCYIPEWLIKI